MPEDLTQGGFVQARASKDLRIFSQFAQRCMLINIHIRAGSYFIALCILLMFIRAPAHSVSNNSCLFIIYKTLFTVLCGCAVLLNALLDLTRPLMYLKLLPCLHTLLNQGLSELPKITVDV